MPYYPQIHVESLQSNDKIMVIIIPTYLRDKLDWNYFNKVIFLLVYNSSIIEFHDPKEQLARKA